MASKKRKHHPKSEQEWIAEASIRSHEDFERWKAEHLAAEQREHERKLERFKQRIMDEIQVILAHGDKITRDQLQELISKQIERMPWESPLTSRAEASLAEIYRFKPDDQLRARRFWRRSLISISGLLLLTAAHYKNPEVAYSAIGAIKETFQVDQTAAEIYVEKIHQDRHSAVYTPARTVDSKASYVDDVLFTRDFHQWAFDAAMQKRWITQLHEFLIQDLGVSDRAIVSIIPKEKALLQKLFQVAESIPAHDPEPSVKRMRELEAEFLDEITRDLGRPANVADFLQFRRTFNKRFTEEP